MAGASCRTLATCELTQTISHTGSTIIGSCDDSSSGAVPQAGEWFVIGSGDERHVNPLTADFVAMQQTDSTDGLLQRAHVYTCLQLIVCVWTEIHTLHLHARVRTHTSLGRFYFHKLAFT